jgi:hypothetical protein
MLGTQKGCLGGTMTEPDVLFHRFRDAYQSKLSNVSNVTVVCLLAVGGVAYVLLEEKRYFLSGLLGIAMMALYFFVVIPVGRAIGDWKDQVREHGDLKEREYPNL